MTPPDITASFAPITADRDSLSRAHRSILDALFQHPVAHGLEWLDVVALIKMIGNIETHANDETCLVLGGARNLFRKPHSKDVPTTMVIDLRHMLTRAGWSPLAVRPLAPAEARPKPVPDVPVVVEHAETCIYGPDVAAGEGSDHLIRADLSPHTLHELADRDQRHGSDTGRVSDPGHYERIAQALHGGGTIILAGHGHGHSNAADSLELYLQERYSSIAQRLRTDSVVYLLCLTYALRPALGRSALTMPEPAADA